MRPQRNLTFRAGELRWIIDRDKLDVAPPSPLVGARRVAPEGSLRMFQDKGALGKEWRAAFAILAQPIQQVRALTPGIEGTRVATFYARRASELVACWPEGDCWRISFPWTPEALAEVAGAALALDLPIPADPFSATFRPAGLALLMAAVDAIREAQLSAVLRAARAAGVTFLRNRFPTRTGARLFRRRRALVNHAPAGYRTTWSAARDGCSCAGLRRAECCATAEVSRQKMAADPDAAAVGGVLDPGAACGCTGSCDPKGREHDAGL